MNIATLANLGNVVEYKHECLSKKQQATCHLIHTDAVQYILIFFYNNQDSAAATPQGNKHN